MPVPINLGPTPQGIGASRFFETNLHKYTPTHKQNTKRCESAFLKSDLFHDKIFLCSRKEKSIDMCCTIVKVSITTTHTCTFIPKERKKKHSCNFNY